jgi:hypothetical protein
MRHASCSCKCYIVQPNLEASSEEQAWSFYQMLTEKLRTVSALSVDSKRQDEVTLHACKAAHRVHADTALSW